ncbi:MAG TPA: hypothetical protein VG960_14475 [Caulobacteraceae bacterium]|nr:hypothetical protein [Caulobacteraceae bacterium]
MAKCRRITVYNGEAKLRDWNLPGRVAHTQIERIKEGLAAARAGRVVPAEQVYAAVAAEYGWFTARPERDCP